jgi:predicted acylesterase/phospholipase RssA
MLTQSKTSRLRKLERQMSKAESYKDWKELALEHDEVSGRAAWKLKEQCKSYDYVEIRSRLEDLRALRAAGDDTGLLFALNEGIHGNMGSMGRSTLYERAKFGTKQLIEEYVDELVESLKHISSLPENEISWEEKIDFFERASQCFGRSALMLSGAGSLGHFHTGVVKVLFEHKLLPNVISGSSAGSVLAGVLGTYTNQELDALLASSNAFGFDQQQVLDEKSLGSARPQINIQKVHEMLAATIPDLTFQEAYEKTGRMINITIATVEQHQTSRLMNAITSPNVFIRTAVLASCAVPGVFPPVMLMAKNVYGEAQPYLSNRRWIDGAVTDDLPAKRLARLYGVNHYIVSQANPLSLMLLNSDRDLLLPQSVKNIWRFAGREMLRSGEQFSRRYLRSWPDVSRTMNMFYSVAAQDYTGDINIIPSFNFVDPQKLLGQLTLSEIEELVDEGERATWTKLDQIRICSRIGRTLDMILDNHSQHDVRRSYKNRGPKSRPQTR